MKKQITLVWNADVFINIHGILNMTSHNDKWMKHQIDSDLLQFMAGSDCLCACLLRLTVAR